MRAATLLDRKSIRSYASTTAVAAHRGGFTMLEMLVVLAILAVLTMLAVQSLGPVEQQARQAATQRLLADVKRSLIDTHSSGDATVVSGFVADLGFLPDCTSPATLVNQLCAGNAPAYQSSPVMPEASGGWRGPYLLLPGGATGLTDGWGRPISLTVADGNFDSLGDQLLLQSLGNPTGSGGPIVVNLSAAMLTATPVSVRLYGLDQDNNRFPLDGEAEVALCGGIDPATGVVAHYLPGSVAQNGTDVVCQFAATPQRLLAGPRVISVTFEPSTSDEYATTAYSPQTLQVNLIPGTSPTFEILVARRISIAGSSGDSESTGGSGEGDAGGGESGGGGAAAP